MIKVTTNRAYADVLGSDHTVIRGLTMVSSIDPITNERRIDFYTDDGNGNGDGVLLVDFSGRIE